VQAARGKKVLGTPPAIFVFMGECEDLRVLVPSNSWGNSKKSFARGGRCRTKEKAWRGGWRHKDGGVEESFAPGEGKLMLRKK